MTHNLPTYTLAEELEYLVSCVAKDREQTVVRVTRTIETFVNRHQAGLLSPEDLKNRIRRQTHLPLERARGHRANAIDIGIAAEDIDHALAEQLVLQTTAISAIVETALRALES